jgi:hypothetical protein
MRFRITVCEDNFPNNADGVDLDGVSKGSETPMLLVFAWDAPTAIYPN